MEDIATSVTLTPIETAAKPPERGGVAGVCRIALVAVTLLLIVISYYPFAWDPPRTVRNEVVRNSDGSLRFGEMNNARTPGTPAWFEEVRTSGVLQIRLEFDPDSLRENASIMMLASNFFTTDFAIVQDHSDLLLYLRRPGLDANGDPPFAVDGLLRSQQWNRVDIVLQHHDIRIAVDGATQLIEAVPADSARVWSQGRIALGDEVQGGGPWQGTIRVAQVRTAGSVVDYIRPGALSIPRSYFYFPDHLLPFPPRVSISGWTSFLTWFLSFHWVSSSSGLGGRLCRVLPATALSAALAVLLAAGKSLFHGRHASVAVIVAEIFGAFLGALLASRLARVKTDTAGRDRAADVTRARQWPEFEGVDNDGAGSRPTR